MKSCIGRGTVRTRPDPTREKGALTTSFSPLYSHLRKSDMASGSTNSTEKLAFSSSRQSHQHSHPSIRRRVTPHMSFYERERRCVTPFFSVLPEDLRNQTMSGQPAMKGVGLPLAYPEYLQTGLAAAAAGTSSHHRPANPPSSPSRYRLSAA